MIQTPYIIALPILIGLFLFILPLNFRMIKGLIVIGTTLLTGYLAIQLFGSEDGVFFMGDCLKELGWQTRSLEFVSGIEKFCSFSLDGLSRLLLFSSASYPCLSPFTPWSIKPSGLCVIIMRGS